MLELRPTPYFLCVMTILLLVVIGFFSTTLAIGLTIMCLVRAIYTLRKDQKRHEAYERWHRQTVHELEDTYGTEREHQQRRSAALWGIGASRDGLEL